MTTTSYSNLSQNINMTSFGDILSHANTMTQGTFWTGMYWMFIIVAFLSSLALGFEIAIMVAFFGGLVLGIFLLYLGLITGTTLGVTIASLFFVILYLMYSSRSQR